MDHKVSCTHFVFIIIIIIVQNCGIEAISEAAGLNFTNIVSKYGYKSEQHKVITEDGYILNIFRLIQPYCPRETKRRPVILMHGYLLSADAWVVSGKSGLGALIADLCLDIWIGNFRGNVYSRNHVELDPDKDIDFWNYSHTEFGTYDLPAMIDYVIDATDADDVNYIGFSQGAGSFYIMCSERPEYSAKVNLMIALAPSTRHLYTESFVFRYLNEFFDIFKDNFNKAGVGEIMSREWLLPELLGKLCQKVTDSCDLIKDLLDSKHSFHPDFVSDVTFDGLFKTFPAGTSVQNAAHFGQLGRSSEFRKFDYGPKKNYDVYGSHKPPSYNLSAVETPVVVLYGLNDGIVDSRDVLWSNKQLPNVLEVYLVKEGLWSHLDVVYSEFVKTLLFPKVREYLLKYS